MTLVLNHPVILGWQVSVGSNECFGCTCTVMHNVVPTWSLSGGTLKYSLVPSPSGVWTCSTELTNSSNNRSGDCFCGLSRVVLTVIDQITQTLHYSSALPWFWHCVVD